MVVTSPSLNLEENLQQVTEEEFNTSADRHSKGLYGTRKWGRPPSTTSNLQGLRSADGLHLFLPFLINIRLHQTVEDDAFYTPGRTDGGNAHVLLNLDAL